MFETVVTSQEEIVIHLVLVSKREVSSTLESLEFVSFSNDVFTSCGEWGSKNTFRTSARTLKKFFFTTGSIRGVGD